MVRVQVLVRLVRGTENCSAGYIFSLTRPQAAGAAGGGHDREARLIIVSLVCE